MNRVANIQVSVSDASKIRRTLVPRGAALVRVASEGPATKALRHIHGFAAASGHRIDSARVVVGAPDGDGGVDAEVGLDLGSGMVEFGIRVGARPRGYVASAAPGGAVLASGAEDIGAAIGRAVVARVLGLRGTPPG